jgi:hypothetical protein
MFPANRLLNEQDLMSLIAFKNWKRGRPLFHHPWYGRWIEISLLQNNDKLTIASSENSLGDRSNMFFKQKAPTYWNATLPAGVMSAC